MAPPIFLPTMTKREVLDHLSLGEEERILLGHIWDKAEQCDKRNIPSSTEFLTPQEQILAQRLLETIELNVNWKFWGGYDGAERCRLYFLPDYLEEVDTESIAVLRCAWHESENLTHRDFLGSLMGLGLTRDSLGDILVSDQEHTADILVLPTLLPMLLADYRQAGRIRFRTQQVETAHVHIPQSATKTVRDTVSSLRLDSVLSSGFSISRTKAMDAIRSGRVEVNWQECRKGDRMVGSGDVLTLRGMGKCELKEVGNPTKKVRYPITIVRYI